MVYSGARRLRILSIWAHTTMLYALERASDHGSTPAVLYRVIRRKRCQSRTCAAPTGSRVPQPTGGSADTTRLGQRASWIEAVAHIAALTRRWEPIENAILVLRAKHPSWGARKLKARLEMLQPDVIWPAASTFGNILESCGIDQSAEEKKTHHAMLRAVLAGHGSESAVVHGFQGILRYWRRQALRSVHHHGRA